MILFDLDDTLFFETEFLHSGYREICNRLQDRGVVPFCEAWRVLMSSRRATQRFDLLAVRVQAVGAGSEFDVRWMVDTYRNHTPRIQLFAGVRAMLRAIQASGEPMGLITDGRSSTQRAKIAALGLAPFFAPENILISEETGADKTTPTPFRMAMERNPSASRFVYVGDNPAKDFLWPNRLGWTTIRLLHPHALTVHPTLRPDLPSTHQPLHTVTSPVGLLQLLHLSS